MSIPSLILDVLFLITVVWMIFNAYKRGFIHSIVQTVGYLASLAVGYFGARVLSEACFQLFFRDKLHSGLENALLSASESGNFEEKIRAVFLQFPDFIQNLLNSYGMGADALVGRLSGTAVENAQELTHVIMDSILHPILILLLNGICFLILFSACMVLVRCLLKLLKGVKHIPLVGTLNAFLGGIMGLLQAAVIWFVIAAAVEFLFAFTDGFSWFNKQTVEQSLLFSRFCEAVQSLFPQIV